MLFEIPNILKETQFEISTYSSSFPGEEMATHSVILTWKIPWTEEPGRLQFMGLQRVGHD